MKEEHKIPDRAETKPSAERGRRLTVLAVYVLKRTGVPITTNHLLLALQEGLNLGVLLSCFALTMLEEESIIVQYKQTGLWEITSKGMALVNEELKAHPELEVEMRSTFNTGRN